MTERTTVRLPQDLLIRAKRKAAAEGRTLTSLIEDGLRLVVTRLAEAGKAQTQLYCGSARRHGGLMPEFEDRNSPRRFGRLDDLEYVERMKHFKP